MKGKGLIESFFLETRLQPRDKFLVQNFAELGDAVPGRAVDIRKSVRRRSTHNLQDALKALQSQLEVFNGSFVPRDSLTDFEPIVEDEEFKNDT